MSYDPATGEYEVYRGRMIREYLSVAPSLGIAIPGQPVKQVCCVEHVDVPKD